MNQPAAVTPNPPHTPAAARRPAPAGVSARRVVSGGAPTLQAGGVAAAQRLVARARPALAALLVARDVLRPPAGVGLAP